MKAANYKSWKFKVDGFRPRPLALVLSTTILVVLIQILLFLNLDSKNIVCKLPTIRQFGSKEADTIFEHLPTIYVITPTYARSVQLAELTRLSQTLLLVPKIHWIIVEDSQDQTDMLNKFVYRLKKKYDFTSITLLAELTPQKFQLKPGDPNWRYPKGVWQRNKALAWLRLHSEDLDKLNGVVYFADDDNTYDLELFSEMRYTGTVAVWPVGLVGGMLVERPIVKSDLNTSRLRVVGYNSVWEPQRPFPLDMAGFALSLRLLLSKPDANFSSSQRVGYVESHFLGQFVISLNELEPKASGCSKVLVWHTQTKSPQLQGERKRVSMATSKQSQSHKTIRRISNGAYSPLDT